MTGLKDRISEDMKAAMRARDSARLGTIRLLQAAIKDFEVNTRTAPDDAQIVAIVEKMVKQRRDSIAAFEKAGRTDLAEQEKQECEVLYAYLPAQLDAAGIAAAVDQILRRFEADNARKPAAADMGPLMAAARQQLAGQADMAQVSACIRAALA